MKDIIRIGSRESKLAMVQSHWVVNEIRKKFPSLRFEIVPIKTTGDVILDRTLDKIGGKGLFIKELEQALLEGRVDLAVHSMKDLPAELHGELAISAVSKREDARDVLVSRAGRLRLEELADGAVLGTSSIRREVQFLEKRPGLQVKTLRGNVLTRLKKLDDGEYDAIVLAMAGLKRLGLEDRVTQSFAVEEVIPAVGQGALGVETRKDADVDYLLESIQDEETALAVKAERAYMIKLDGGCSAPIAAHGVLQGQGSRLKLYGMYASEDKSKIYRAEIEGPAGNAEELGVKLAEEILEKVAQAD